MGTYTLEELMRRWHTGELSTEQAIGQMLLLLKELELRVRELERAQVRQQNSGTTR